MTRALGLSILVVGALACAPATEELPRVVTKTGLEPQEPCFKPPDIRPGPRPVLSRAADPSRCVAKSLQRIMAQVPAPFRLATLPVEVSITPEGGVKELRFYDACNGMLYLVDDATSRCVESAIFQWRYEPESSGCPRTAYIDKDQVQIAQPSSVQPTLARECEAPS